MGRVGRRETRVVKKEEQVIVSTAASGLPTLNVGLAYAQCCIHAEIEAE